jgi:hypothetical protein
LTQEVANDQNDSGHDACLFMVCAGVLRHSSANHGADNDYAAECHLSTVESTIESARDSPVKGSGNQTAKGSHTATPSTPAAPQRSNIEFGRAEFRGD